MKKVVAAAVLILVLLFSLSAGEIRFEKIKFSDSEILSADELSLIVDECSAKYTGMELLNAITDRINALYLEKGYPNARAYVPEQTSEDGSVLIELVEGRMGDMTVSGNTYTNDRYVLRSLGMDGTGVLNLTELERKLIAFNRWHSGIALSSVLNPGQNKPGTTDIDINVTETYPTGFYCTFDNYATQATGDWRLGTHLVMNSLTRNRDTLLAGAYMNFYARSVYLDYGFPFFLGKRGVEMEIGATGTYGSSEAASGSASIFNIRNESFSGSARVGMVVGRTPERNMKVQLSGSYSRTATSALDTPLTAEGIGSLRLGFSSAFVFNSLYISALAGASVGLPFEGSSSDGCYGKFDASLYARLSLGSLYFSVSASGQLMPFNTTVPSQELLHAGGASTVRGYSEGCAWGKSGYIARAEFHFMLPDSARSSVFGFIDHAGIFPYPDIEDHFLLSMGAGLEIFIEKIIHLETSFAIPLISIYQDMDAPDYRFHVSVKVSTQDISV